MDKIYCAEQIEVPEELPAVVKALSKEVIRFQPKDINAFCRDYFDSACKGELEAFLERQRAELENSKN